MHMYMFYVHQCLLYVGVSYIAGNVSIVIFMWMSVLKQPFQQDLMLIK